MFVLIMWLLNFSQNHEPRNPETSCSWWPASAAHRSSDQEADAPTCPRDYPWVGETSSLVLYIFFEELTSLFRFPAIITAIFSKVRVISSPRILDAILFWNVTHFSSLPISPLSPRPPSSPSKPRYLPRKVSRVQNQKVAKVVERVAKLCSRNQTKDMVGGVRAGRYHISIQDWIIPRLV